MIIVLVLDNQRMLLRKNSTERNDGSRNERKPKLPERRNKREENFCTYQVLYSILFLFLFLLIHCFLFTNNAFTARYCMTST